MITSSLFSQYWHLRLASLLAIVGVIAYCADRTCAQITPDNTLGAESSVVMPDVDIKGTLSDRIDGGAIRAGNLFHSFREFNVGEGRGVYFTNPAGIENILSRVTGNNVSNIFGKLGVLGNANLFLINPNGIIFGPNARLDVNGSFLASTASSLKFADGTEFSATAPQTTPLLTISVPIGLQYGKNAESVQVRGSNLQVAPGKTLALTGGNVQFDGGLLLAQGGNIELGGLAGEDIVGLFTNNLYLNLSFPVGVPRGDVSITNGAQIYVRGAGGGSIAINARNLNMRGSTRLWAGIASGRGSIDSQAGDIEINATETINLNASAIFNGVEAQAVGKTGNVNITTGSLSLTNGAQLGTIIRGEGKAGSLNINARDTVSFDGVSAAFSQVDKGSVGKGGDINITTGSLSVTNGAQLVANTEGQGDAGNVNINARDTVSFDYGDALSDVEEGAVGKGGNINITAGSLFVTNGAQLQADTEGQGDAGSININARDTASFDGISSDGWVSWASSLVEKGSVGKGGDINITAGSLFVTNGAQLVASTRGKGNAGSLNINIMTGSLYVTSGGQLQAETRGQGDAGSININARDTVSFDGVDSDGYSSAALNNVVEGAVGNGGNINITTGSLSVTNGAQLSANTEGQGDAGSININARDTVSFDVLGAAFTDVEEGSVGKGGDINITTGSLFVNNGAQLQADTEGQGNAGSINIHARDTASFDGVSRYGYQSAVFSTVQEGAVGNGGNINIASGALVLTNGARLSTSSEGNGAAGNIEVAAESIRLNNQASLSSDTRAGQGDIFLRSQDLVLRRGSNITTNATGIAEGGSINIDTKFLVAVPEENSDISANAQNARGGRIRINATGIFGTKFRNQITPESDITATSELGPQFSGTVQINTPATDPTQGIVELPAQVVDVSGLIAQGCTPGSGTTASQFTITGRGGLPPNPGELLSSEPVWEDTRLISVTANQQRSSTVTATPPSEKAAAVEILPATGWVFNNKGEVILTALAPNAASYSSTSNSNSCRVR